MQIQNEYSASKIKRYCRIINKRFRDTVKAKCIEWQVKAFKNPHMSIARELTNVEILLSYDLLGNDFTHSFQCNSFVIRKLNEFKGQYDIIDEIPLSGRGFLDDGPQMTIKFD